MAPFRLTKNKPTKNQLFFLRIALTITQVTSTTTVRDTPIETKSLFTKWNPESCLIYFQHHKPINPGDNNVNHLVCGNKWAATYYSISKCRVPNSQHRPIHCSH